MDVSGVQQDDAFPTGQVRVDLDGGEPTFHILPDQAYDHLDLGQALQATRSSDFSLLYHGSLISRARISRRTVGELRRGAAVPVFVDVNLRDPWWTWEEVATSLQLARWAKVNEAELDLLTSESGEFSECEVSALAESFRSHHVLDAVILTRGSRGAMVVEGGGCFEAPPPAEIHVVDTVGAGDAFSAVFILGLAAGWTTRLTLEKALEFAAEVCTISGATTGDRELYSSFTDTERW
jgi:fructokinase